MLIKMKKNLNHILSMVLGCLLMLSAYTNCASTTQVSETDDDEKVIMVAVE